MSAIHGVLRFDGESVSESDLIRQSNVLGHRGPDRRATWHEGAIGIGHRLLRVTREDSSDAQPLHDRQGALALVADLRLDNREQLAAALSTDPDAANVLPDSALLLKAYGRWGDACVEHLVGDFAFAIWDGRAKTLVLARDHMGQRHLLLHRGKDFFAFASELKALWALPDVPQELDEATMARRLVLDQTPFHGATYFAGIRGLEGGTVMRVTAAGDISTRRYWEPQADPRHLNRDEQYYVQAYRDILTEAVACRIRRGKHPPALLLAGGFDSGAIAGLASAALAGQDRKLIGVASVSAENEPLAGVRKWTQLLARDLPNLTVRPVTRDGLDIFSNLESNFLQAGEPHSQNRYAADALYAEAAAAGARVVMDGHGGDYTLNPRGAGWLARRLRRGQFRLFFSEFRAYRRHSGASLAQALKSEVVAQFLPVSMRSAWRRFRAGHGVFEPLAPITPLLLQTATASGRRIDTRAVMRRDEPAPQMATVLRRQQSNAAIGGALLAASHGLEFTQPFHDKRVVELALAIPETLHVKEGKDRYLARTALKDIYPPEFQARGRINDDLIPDFDEMAERIKPRLLAEIARMENDGSLSRYFDFPRMRKMLSRQRGPGGGRRTDGATRMAIRTFIYARFVEWMRRRNRSGS